MSCQRRGECRITIVLSKNVCAIRLHVINIVLLFFIVHFIIESRIQTAELNKFSVYLFVMESFPLADSFVSKPGDDIIVWQMRFGVFFNGGHSWSIHVQTCWKPLSDDHKSKSDSLQKEICHRTFNQTLVWLRSGRIIVL